MNGDGRTDLVSFPNGKLNTFLAKSDNSGTFENAILLTPPAAKFDSTRVWALDVNGDGRMDIVSYKNGKLFTYISNFSGSTGSFNSPTEFTIPASQFNPLYVWPGDYNGDGMQDLLTHEAGILYAHLSNGTGTSWTMVSTNPSGFDHTFAWVGDVNGDGLSDIVTRPTQQVYTYFAKGDGTFVTGTVYSAPGSVFGAYDTWAIDINGDGRADLLSITQSGSTVYLHAHYSKGDGTYFLVTSAKDTSTIEDPSFVWVGDFSGDGKVDVLSYVTLGPVTTHTAHINSATDRFPDLLTNITNPFSGVNTITYKPLSDGTPFYIKDTDSPCPATENPCSSTMHVQDPRYVVSNLLVKDSLGTGPDHEYSYSYRFGGARWHHLGRGNLGFRWMEEVDVSANAKTSTFYNQIFPLIGLPTNVEYDRNSDSAQFKDTVHEYWDLQAYPTVAPTLRFVAPKKVDIYERDGSATLSRTIRRVFSYDSSATGNLISTFHYGDIAVTGDEREEVTEFIPVDPIAWLHRAKTLKLKDGAGNVVREKFLYYDDQPHGVLGGAGLVTKEEANAGGGIGHAANPVFLYTNDSATGVRTNVRDPRLCDTTTVHESTKTFPQSVAVCSNITALNFVTTYEYDPRHGVVKSRTEPNRVGDSPLSTTTFDYDGFGRLTKITGPLDTASTYGTETRQYLDWGDAALQRVVTLRTEDHGTGNVIFMEEYFDGLGRIDKVRREGPDTSTSGKTIVTDALFDSQNRVTRQSAPYFINSSGAPLETPKYDLFTYDPLGRPTQVTHADNNFATKLYERGVVTLTNERGKITKQHYDGLEQLTKVQEFNSSSTYDTLYQRDAAGLLKTLTNALGHITRIDYDKLGRKRAMCDPNMGTPSNVTACLFTAPPTGAWIYTYNPAGDLMSQKDAKNQQLDFTYDELGRPKTKQQGSTVITRWTYDDAVVMHSKGRLTKVEDLPATQNTITNFTYDVLGRVTQSQRVLMGATHTMAQTYDALGRIRTETFPAPDNETVTYNYDEAGWLKSVTNYINDIQYDARGQKTSLTYANSRVTSWTYDPNRFWIASQTTDGNQQSLTYLHDPVGNITSISDGLFTASRTLTYDDLNRLATASGTFGTNQSQQNCTYGYNAIGNFLDKCGAVLSYSDAMHPSAVTNNSVTGKNYIYDSNGNMTARGNQTLTWDIENRVTSVAISGGGTTSMEYDYSGMRVKKNAPTGITLFPFKGIEIDPNGTFTKFIKIGNETFASKKRTSGGATSQFFYHNDHLGSVNVITDITGARCQLNEYEPWGGVSRSEGPTPGSQPTCDSTHRFTGQELDPETGFYYYGARYFDQEIGRFVSPDPFVQEPDMPQNLNRYSYVLDNPVNLTDPNGQFFFELFSIVMTVLSATLPAMEGLTLAKSLAQLAATAMVQAVGANLDHAIEASKKAELQKQREARGDPSRNAKKAQPQGENRLSTNVSSGDQPGEKPWWQRLNEWCIICDAQAGEDGRGGPPFPPGWVKRFNLPDFDPPGGGGPGAMRRNTYVPSPKHTRVDRGGISRAPINGQDALDVSIQVSPTAHRRVGIDYKTGEIVVFDRTQQGIYHGHVRPWGALEQDMKNELVKWGLTDRRGRILD